MEVANAPPHSGHNVGTREDEYTEKQRVLDAIPGLASTCLITFGFQGLNTCAGVASLPAYAITFGFLNLLSAIYKFAFRIPMNPRLQKDDLPTKFAGIPGIATIGVAVWGAVITWPKAGGLFSGTVDCPQDLGIAGFISSLIPLVIVLVMILWSIASLCIAKLLGANESVGDESSQSPA